MTNDPERADLLEALGTQRHFLQVGPLLVVRHLRSLSLSV